MATPLPISFRISPLVPGKSYTPQQFADAIASRLTMDTQEELSLFVSGSVAPTTDQGPWLANGQTWYAWDPITGAYVPQPLSYRSLKYIASETAPDQNVYTLWIRLDSAGKAQELRYYSGGSWKSVYDDSFLAVLSQIAEAKQQVPFRADSPGNQTILYPGSSVDINLNQTFDPVNVFAANEYTCPAGGYYQFNLKVAMQTAGGSPTGNTVIVWLLKNGNKIATEFATTPIVNGVTGLRTYTISTILQLITGDVISAYVETNSTGGAGDWVVLKEGTYMSGHRVLTP